MRELTHVEMEMVEGGNPAVVAAIAVGAVVLAGLAVVAYGVSQGCSGSVTVNETGIKVEVTCPAN